MLAIKFYFDYGLPAFGPSPSVCAPVAQLDRAPHYGCGGQEFESLRVRHHFCFASHVL